jgi:hypothetical protein
LTTSPARHGNANPATKSYDVLKSGSELQAPLERPCSPSYARDAALA